MKSVVFQKGWFSPLVHLSNNAISFVGVLLTTTGAVAWFFVLPLHVGSEGAVHPYLGILFFLLLPAVFFSGLVLIPVGIFLRLRKQRRQKSLPSHFPPVNWRNREFQRLVSFVALATGVNVVIGGQLTYGAVEHMDSVSFCGQTCHTVMKPEFTAYQDSPHFRVSCVDCHIGAGASWFVQSKLSGVGQVFATVLNTYSRPIPTPIHNLRPARETCETCHWPQMFSGYRLRVVDKFAADEQNSASKTVLLMRIGGGAVTTGIHGVHLAPGVVIEYASDSSRKQIPWVRYTDSSGHLTEYAVEDWKTGQEQNLEQRVMDCIDCHNRPTHSFQLPDRALDAALAADRIDRTLPMAKKQGLEILSREYTTTAEAATAIPQALRQFYRLNYPEVYRSLPGQVERAGQELLAVYQRNVFPEMKITWGTYPNNIGHTDFPGCFRCHDDSHVSVDGKAISQDCGVCHKLLAIEESEPEIISLLGISK